MRALREERGWGLSFCASQLGVSASYLSQIENNQRPLSGRVVTALVDAFGVEATALYGQDQERLVADLREACAIRAQTDPIPLTELKRAAAVAPRLARDYLDLHQSYRQLDARLKLASEAVDLDAEAGGSLALPYEEVRDYFHYQDNYVHELDLAAEALSAALPPARGSGREGDLEAALLTLCGLRVERAPQAALLHSVDASARRLLLGGLQAAETRVFQMACALAAQQLSGLIEQTLSSAPLRSASSRDICRVALTNYAAGALLMPYREFTRQARTLRHDVERLAAIFGVSLEQVCHRLSTLQRPGARGVPIYFLRMDGAGNITKRHSATRFQFARFGGTCPLWNVHDAFASPDRFLIQVAAMPDGARYLSVARSLTKSDGAFTARPRRYVVGFGCELQHARAFVYADAIDLRGEPTPIGVSCRICPRTDCAHRAFPPLDRQIHVPRGRRDLVPFELAAGEPAE